MKSSTLRAKLGITRAEWAWALNVHERTVARWEEERVDPGGLADQVVRGITAALLEPGADAKVIGRRIAELGIHGLLLSSLTAPR